MGYRNQRSWHCHQVPLASQESRGAGSFASGDSFEVESAVSGRRTREVESAAHRGRISLTSHRNECPIGLGQEDAPPARTQAGEERNLASGIHHRIEKEPEGAAPRGGIVRISQRPERAAGCTKQSSANLEPHAGACTKSQLSSSAGSRDIGEGNESAPTGNWIPLLGNGLKATLRG